MRGCGAPISRRGGSVGLGLAVILAVGCGSGELSGDPGPGADETDGADAHEAAEAGAEESYDAGADAHVANLPSDLGATPDEGPEAAPQPSRDATVAEDGAEPDADPEPAPLTPCDPGRCWLDAPALGGRCGASSIDEDYSSERYNVHRYPLTVPAEVSVEVRVRASAGDWSPALVVHTPDGVTIYDGEQASADAPGIELEPRSTGRDGGPASLGLWSVEEAPLQLFVTSWEVVDGGFEPAMPADVEYALSVVADCPVPEATCPLDPARITRFGSGFFRAGASSDPASPDYDPYKRDNRTSHSGYDIYADRGTEVVATQGGDIIAASPADVGDCGRSVNLAADSGVTFRYCHLDRVLVAEGRVEPGTPIGLCGQSGNAHAPHVHFVYLDVPDERGSGAADVRSPAVNEYVDRLCR